MLKISDHILLKKIVPKDATQMALLANNPKIWANVRDIFPQPYRLEDAENFIQLIDNEIPQTTFGIYLENTLIGVCGLTVQKDIHRFNAEIGYWLGEPYWNRGITSKVVKKMVEYGFSSLGLHRIYAGVFEYNLPSMKVLEKVGFSLESIHKEALYKNGKFYDEYLYALINV
jgi:RimJ/RimL family protein N-acetyltransferase